MAVDPAELRLAMGHLVTGVCVVTAPRDGEEPCGLTVNSIASVSLDPPLILICVDRAAASHDCIRDAGVFAVSILASDQERVSRRFASWDLSDKLRGVAYRAEATGAPVLEGALAWLDCRLWAEYPGGDHTIFVGEVLAADAREASPLLYYRGGYGRFVP